MWDQADYSLSELVNMAVDCIDPDSENWRVSGFENTRRFERLMPILMEEIDLDSIEYRISESNFRVELRDFLNDIKQEDEPGAYFLKNTGELHRRIGTKEQKQYTIGFPLNLKFNPRRKQDSYESLGHEIERISRGQWLSEFKEVAEEIERDENHQHEDDPFTDFMEQVPNDFSHHNYTFWKFELEARDEQFAVDRLEKLLGYLLGRINAAAHVNQTEGWSTSRSIWPSGWCDLRHPFMYIVFEDDDFSQFYYEEDISPRNRFKVMNHRTRLFDIYFDKFPELEYPLEPLEERLVETVRRFQSAITEPNREDSFLEYWRGIEALTLTTETEGMDTVIRRAEAPIETSDQDFFRYRLKRTREKRNLLVHDGVDVSVTKQDQNLLKVVLENLIWMYCENFGAWSEDDFRFVLENVGHSEGDLEKSREGLVRKTELLDTLLDAKKYEETVFQKIYRDWASGRNELADAAFTDPLGFFFPVFGVGTEDAEVVVIADAPTYPVSEDEMLSKRDQVRGWRPALTTWESIDEYREWLGQLLEHGNPDGVWDVLQAVAEATDSNPDDLYYTTLQKDGKFNESLEETEDGEDPVVLNEESIAKWKPYLKAELDHVNPDLVIVFGETALEALGDLFAPSDDFDLSSVPYGEIYVFDRYPVLRFDYWSKIEVDDGSSLEEQITQSVRDAL